MAGWKAPLRRFAWYGSYSEAPGMREWPTNKKRAAQRRPFAKEV